MAKVTHTVSVASVYRQLSSKIKTDNIEQAVIDEVKRQFERSGIIFYDKPGLYPIPPSHSKYEKPCSGMEVITISQDRL